MASSDPVVILSAARTPLGRFIGELSPLSAHKLGAIGVNFDVWSEQNGLLSAPDTGGSVFWMDPDQVRKVVWPMVSTAFTNRLRLSVLGLGSRCVSECRQQPQFSPVTGGDQWLLRRLLCPHPRQESQPGARSAPRGAALATPRREQHQTTGRKTASRCLLVGPGTAMARTRPIQRSAQRFPRPRRRPHLRHRWTPLDSLCARLIHGPSLNC